VTHKGSVTLETERLILRRFTLDDAGAMLRNLYGDAEAMRYLPWETHTDISKSRALMAGYAAGYADEDYYAWAIVPKSVGEPIGYTGIFVDNGIDAVAVSYGIGKPWWCQGYTSEALAALIRFFFDEVGVNRVYATHDPRNPNSGAVMRKCGMTYEGTLRQARKRKGEYSDRAMYAILAEEYKGLGISSVNSGDSRGGARDYTAVEAFMLAQMSDSAHDREHIYRVLNYALNIARCERDIDYDVLVTACLLHDIGRAEQFADPTLDHAEVGADKASEWLLRNGFAPEFAKRVSDCIRSHRFRASAPPQSIEAKILFDADKVDVCGAIGIARTLFYGAQVGVPLYTLTNGVVSDGADNRDSVFGEYKIKLEKLYDRFYTARGAELAAMRQANAARAYADMLSEARECYANGAAELERLDIRLAHTT
jgi:uncharacterized protein